MTHIPVRDHHAQGEGADVSPATKATRQIACLQSELRQLQTEVRNLDLDLAAVWEKYGEGGVSLAEGLRRIGRPSLLERDARREAPLPPEAT